MSLKHILICDFDETITRKDTISLLAKLPYKRPTARELPPWTHFTQNYMKAYELYAKPNTRCLPLIPQDVLNFRHKIMKSNYKDLFSEEFAYQKQARKVELASIEELEKYKLFQGITANSVKQYVGSLQEEQIRPGFTEVWRNTDEQYVLSINWSREFIRDVLAEKELQVNEENIYCNKLLISDDGSYTGMFDKGIMTGSDKVRVLECILDKIPEQPKKVWYIGDSETDLLSILHPKVNGVLLLNPSENLDKFIRITVDLLGLSRDQMMLFAEDTTWKKFALNFKEEGFLILLKSWEDMQQCLE